MPGPFEKPASPEPDKLSDALEQGARARQILQLGVGDDLTRRREKIIRQAELELRGGLLTPDRAFMHVACANALRAYREALTKSVEGAQRAADQLHADTAPPEDGNL